MAQDSTYNGWTNYATWRVNLEICADLINSMIGETTFDDVGTLADFLRDYVHEHVCGEDYDQVRLATQYAMAFLDEVNWYEIAGHAEDELVRDEDQGE
jgi:hypothetical protein